LGLFGSHRYVLFSILSFLNNNKIYSKGNNERISG
jgi:hypothetical protein